MFAQPLTEMLARRPSPLTVFVPLNLSDWHPVPNGGMGYFKCRALGLHGVQVTRLWVEGSEPLTSEHYEVRGRRLYWKNGVPPANLEVEMLMRRGLRSPREVFLAAVLGILLGAYAMANYPQLESVVHEIQNATVALADAGSKLVRS